MSLRNAFLILLLPLLLYLSAALQSDFVALDDELLIIDNPTVHGLTWKNIKNAFTSYDPELYIPLTLLSYQIDDEIWGLSSMGFHLTNLLLHIANALLIFLIIKKFLDEKTALIAALLFGIHPLNTEAVMWTSARKDLLMGFFFLLSLNLYFAKRKKWSLCTFILACLSKVTAVMLPFIVLLIDWHQLALPYGGRARERGSIWNFMLNKIPYFVISFVFVFIALFGKQTQTSFSTPFLISFVAIPFSLGKFFYPTNLSIFYPFTDDVVWTHPSILAGAFLSVAITIVCWLIRKPSSLPFISWITFLILLAPSLSNVLKGGGYDTLDVYITSDRYMYLPLLALLPITAYFLTRKPLLYLTPIIILALSYKTYTQAQTWRSSETLFAHAIASQQNTHVAYNNLAGIYAQNGDLERARELYEHAKAIKPTWRTLFNLGQIYGSLERFPDAIASYHELLKIRPDYAEALAQLGGLLLRTGHIQQALMPLERARMLDPNIVSVHYNLGLIYEYSGNKTKAEESFRQVLEINPEDLQAKGKLGKS